MFPPPSILILSLTYNLPLHNLTDVDFICNWLGNQAWTLGLEWSGKAEFNAASVRDWATPDGVAAGKARTFGNFTFLQVFNAG